MKFGDRSIDMTLKLKLDGDKLSGAMLGRNGKETPIQDAAYKNGNVSFKVVRERGGKKSTSSYTGTLSGDTIKGKMEFGQEAFKAAIGKPNGPRTSGPAAFFAETSRTASGPSPTRFF